MQTKLTKLFLSVISIMMFNIVYAQCDMPENTLSIDGSDIWYNASSDIGGFQFNVAGATINGASGGDAEASGFTISSSSTTVLGFSFTGSVVSAGCGTLLSLDLSGEPTGLTDIVISAPSGNALEIAIAYASAIGGGRAGIRETTQFGTSSLLTQRKSCKYYYYYYFK